MSINSVHLVTISGIVYENVTTLWQPHLNTLEATLAFVIPGLYLVLTSALLYKLGANRLGWRQIVKIYQDKKNCIYFEEYFGEELFALITEQVDPNIKLKINMYRHECRARENKIRLAAESRPAATAIPRFSRPSLFTAGANQGFATPFPRGTSSRMMFQRPRFINPGMNNMACMPNMQQTVPFGHPTGIQNISRAEPLPPIRPLLLPSPHSSMTLPPEIYELFDKPLLFKFHVYWRTDGIYLSAPGVQLPIKFCDQPAGVKRVGMQHVWVSGKQLITAQKCSPFSCATSKRVRLVWSMLKLIVLPIGKIAVDHADVMVDVYYFVRLDSGDLISRAITRNVFVTYGILTFGILGAIKSTVFAYLVLEVVKNSYDETANVRSHVLKIMAACFKIVVEDGPELLLEYFYVDKYITSNPPWWIIFKDIVTTLLYLLPIIRLVNSGSSTYKLLRTSSTLYLDIFGTHVDLFKWSRVFVCCAFVHFFFSFTMIVRVMGMIYQYSSTKVAEHCLNFTDTGELVQTPFSFKCLNGFDYVILILMVIVVMLFLIICSYVFFVKVGDLLKYFRSEHKNVVRYSVNGENCYVKKAERYENSGSREAATLIRFDCETRKYSKETVRKEEDCENSVCQWKIKNHFSEPT